MHANAPNLLASGVRRGTGLWRAWPERPTGHRGRAARTLAFVGPFMAVTYVETAVIAP
jgi:hypothetical protein